MTYKDQKLDWSGIALLEYLISKKTFKKKFKALDIGGSLGSHTNIMRSYGLSVDIIDKYEKNAEFSGDFNKHKFKEKYDLIFCSHVIEHQRNPGLFLDKIFDCLKDEGDLIITAPKHPAERFVEGHILSTILPVFLQMLIYAGFDCKKGKMISLVGIENSFIVKKAKNFSLKERDETGYKWTENHKSRSPIELRAGYEIPNVSLHLNNCEVFKIYEREYDEKTNSATGLIFNPPKNYKKNNVSFFINTFKQFSIYDSNKNLLANLSNDYVNFNV